MIKSSISSSIVCKALSIPSLLSPATGDNTDIAGIIQKLNHDTVSFSFEVTNDGGSIRALSYGALGHLTILSLEDNPIKGPAKILHKELREAARPWMNISADLSPFSDNEFDELPNKLVIRPLSSLVWFVGMSSTSVCTERDDKIITMKIIKNGFMLSLRKLRKLIRRSG